jgi:hypothetical protein
VKDLRKNFEIMISSGSVRLDDHQSILNILSKLKPQTTSAVKHKQIGNGDDGTYIIHQQNNIDVLLTAGVGDDISFELNFASMYPNCRFVLLDHTVLKLPKKLTSFITVNIEYDSKLSFKILKYIVVLLFLFEIKLIILA